MDQDRIQALLRNMTTQDLVALQDEIVGTADRPLSSYLASRQASLDRERLAQVIHARYPSIVRGSLTDSQLLESLKQDRLRSRFLAARRPNPILAPLERQDRMQTSQQLAALQLQNRMALSMARESLTRRLPDLRGQSASLLAGMAKSHTDQPRAPAAKSSQVVTGISDSLMSTLQASPTSIAIAKRKTIESFSPKKKLKIDQASKPPTGRKTFPVILYDLLIDMERKGKTDIISFTHDGKAFCIHKPLEFLNEISPIYFSYSKLASFKRQLQLYHFKRMQGMPGNVRVRVYFHQYLVRGKPELASQIQRGDVVDKCE
jgi:HSF-type DNA-binding